MFGRARRLGRGTTASCTACRQHQRQEPRLLPEEGLDAAGYKVPADHRRADALTDQIKATATRPWCMGIESGAATGWPATDWFEDLMLKYGGADELQQVGQPQDPVRRPAVKTGRARVRRSSLFTDGNVLGGRKSIASTDFGTRRQPDVRQPAGLLPVQAGQLHHQPGFFPEEVVGRHRQQRRRLRLPAGRRPAATSRSSAAATWPACSARTTPTPRRSMKFLGHDGLRQRTAPRPARSSRRTRTSTLAKYPNETTRADREVAYELDRRSCSTAPTRCRARSARHVLEGA